MCKYWILLLVLLASGIFAIPQSNGNDDAQPPPNLDPSESESNKNEVQQRFQCPVGFFRLRRICYYLSAGTATWRDAHFHCMARNSSLAVLDRSGKEKALRKYLQDDKFRKLERWIGGIFNWQKMSWEWGATGNKLKFQNFVNPESAISKKYAWHCIVLDPIQQYKWNTSTCVDAKYFICEVPAVRINKSRQRKNINDPHAPQSQRLRSSKKDRNKAKGGANEVRHKNKLKSMRMQNWQHNEDNLIWSHGIKPGAVPPKGALRLGKKTRRNGNRRDRTKKHRHQDQFHSTNPVVSSSPTLLENKKVKLENINENSFPGDGRIMPSENTNRLDVKDDYHNLFGNNVDFTREEILLKM